ncbi:XRE family transcriptional regulator [Massilia arenosa]|uniref:XRE family transcriptional regulator n=1 Tax=Zemynaea arenosa TaxID=2561931 RepID=A0A4Y9RW69_9BURK|nr:helix-turn-helix transcriptional regulator [Massilia arenosa]TFW13334.1 XRE family transcriptional regulator [Massilia arenosa]
MEIDPKWRKAIRQAFGDRVREVRHAKGLSQEELALRAGVDRSYLGQVERGERNLTLENIYRIAEGLGVPPGGLIGQLDQSLDLGQGGDNA